MQIPDNFHFFKTEKNAVKNYKHKTQVILIICDAREKLPKETLKVMGRVI